MEVGSLRYIVKDTAVEQSINLWKSLEELKEKVENKRYIAERTTIPELPSSSRHIENLEWNDWQAQIHMSNQAFHKLLDKICRHPTFHRHGIKTQFDVRHQLVSTLRYFVNPSAHSKIASDLGVGYGSTFKMMERVIEAILSLEPEYLRWPNSNRRHKLAQDTDNPIPGCIGYIESL
ncbi:hypothetical protein TRICI_004324 [Trichomonascus ciferrii]|uniref:Transposase Helix-turn-helix domain-containing protein n=1 Tax=Trichomonascus ciferrii TaxID=44093 RepID=A0A642V7H8_9ASCO|nr:hypothetical protein TRICI_004324 [Trichomonascus ciferrii]